MIMATLCTYDNPVTFLREVWIDGKKGSHLAAEIIEDPNFTGDKHLDFRLSTGPWLQGKCVGSIDAINLLDGLYQIEFSTDSFSYLVKKKGGDLFITDGVQLIHKMKLNERNIINKITPAPKQNLK